ncbi:MAG TPA: hypothetical protein VEX69_09990 [Candidatus Limnocylindria bacterium]|nr:hypothetical protein [Candidatus Limnocylindria bacterium]
MSRSWLLRHFIVAVSQPNRKIVHMIVACCVTSAVQMLNWSDGLDGLIAIAVILAVIIALHIRQGHNAALEQTLAEHDFGSPETFRGNLIVREHRSGVFLKLGPDTTQVTWWRQLFRRILAPKLRPLFVAPIQEADFDGSLRQVTLRTKNDSRVVRFDEFSAIRMREFAAGKSLTSFWTVELIPHKGRPIRIVESPRGSREAAFNHTAPLLKSISAITGLPMQVHVAGNVWTPGWPPKIKASRDAGSGRTPV